METKQEIKETELGIGNEEMVTLKPAIVKVESVSIDEIPTKKGISKKVVCLCKHPEKLDLIRISEVKYENKGKLEATGLWINKDSKGLIRKNSALAVFLQHTGSLVISNLVGKELPTTTDDKGYLCFKAY